MSYDEYTAADRDQIISAHARGVSWEEIGASLTPRRSSEAVQLAARRMRRRGEWPDDPHAVREFARGPGRPRNRRRTRTVSPRFAPDVAATLRAVAEAAELRLGDVLESAMRRAVDRHQGRKVSREPLGLDPGRRKVQLAGGPRSETVSVCVGLDTYDEFVAASHPRTRPSTAIAAAAVRLLSDLNYTIARDLT